MDVITSVHVSGWMSSLLCACSRVDAITFMSCSRVDVITCVYVPEKMPWIWCHIPVWMQSLFFACSRGNIILYVHFFFMSSLVCMFLHFPLHLSINRKGRWGTTDDLTTNFLCFSVISTALWDFVNSRPVHSLMLSSYLFFCLPCLLPLFTVPCKMFGQT